jgi:hypothetical protein
VLFKELVNSLIPDELKSKTVIYDSIQILLEYIEDNNNFSYDISRIFTENNSIVKDSLVSAYLENIKSAYEKALLDENISERLTKLYATINMQYSPSNINNISDILNEEYIYTAKEFKQKKGSIPAIEYAYNAIRGTGIQGIDVSTDLQDRTFSVKEGTPENPNEPFMFQVEGSLYEEVYDNTVKPIVHPVGFGYFYSKLTSLFFDEFVSVTVTYPNTIAKVVCTTSGTTLDYSNLTVVSVIEEVDETLHKKISVIFDNGTKLVRDFNTTVTLRDLTNTPDPIGNIIQQFPDYCALFLSYAPVIATTITDSVSTEIENYEEEFIGYTPGTLKTINNFTIGSINIGGLVYTGFINEDFSEVFEVFDQQSMYYTYSDTPALIGDIITVGNKFTWKIGNSVIDSYIMGEVYDIEFEIGESFLVETI